MTGATVDHTYVLPGGGRGMVTAVLTDPGGMERDRISFEIPRLSHHPRPVAAMPVIPRDWS